MKRWLIGLVLAILIFAALFFVYIRTNQGDTIKALETARVEYASVREVLVETGMIRPQVGAEVKIGARATGTIEKMNVKIGDRVRKGQLIALVDEREIRESIEQIKRKIDAMSKRIKEIELTYPARIREAEHSVAEMEASFRLALLGKKRKEQLYEKGFISQQEMDEAVAEFFSAEARLKKTKEMLKRLKDEYTMERSIQQSELERLKAELRQKEIALSYTRIYSPIDGVVSQIAAQEGETIVTGLQVANLVTVVDPTRLEMWIYIDETDIGKVKPGQKVEFYVDAYPERRFTGFIERVYPEPEVRDNIVYYLAIVKVSKEDTEFLKPQMTTHVNIIIQEKERVLTVPNSALRYEGGKQIVYLVDEKGLIKREISTGITGEHRTEVLSGLKEGDLVATKLIVPPQ